MEFSQNNFVISNKQVDILACRVNRAQERIQSLTELYYEYLIKKHINKQVCWQSLKVMRIPWIHSSGFIANWRLVGFCPYACILKPSRHCFYYRAIGTDIWFTKIHILGPKVRSPCESIFVKTIPIELKLVHIRR